MYTVCAKDAECFYSTQRSYSQNVSSVEQWKVAVTPFEEKRYLIPDSTDSSLVDIIGANFKVEIYCSQKVEENGHIREFLIKVYCVRCDYPLFH